MNRPSQSNTVRADIDVRWDMIGAESAPDTVIAIVENPDGRVSYWRSHMAHRFDPFALGNPRRATIADLVQWVAGFAADQNQCACGAWKTAKACITCELHAERGAPCDNVHCKVCS